MTNSTPQRKTDPESIPAVPAAPMDASFFARLRVMDEGMFLTAVSASAMRGRLHEVSQALLTLRADLYEPLLWKHEIASLSLPQHPMGAIESKHASKTYFSANNIWGVVALALTSPESSWNEVFKETFVHRSDSRIASPFDKARQIANKGILDQAIKICVEQTKRTFGENDSHAVTYADGPDGMPSNFGLRPWVHFLHAMSTGGCLWSDLETVVDAIPQKALERNTHDYQNLMREIVSHGNVPTALRLAKRHPELLKGLIDISAYGSLGHGVEYSIIDYLPGVVGGYAQERQRELCVDSALELIELCSKGHREPAVPYLDALQRMLGGLADKSHTKSAKSQEGSRVPQRNLIAGLVARIDDAFETAPGEAWPATPVDSRSMLGQDSAMTRLLDVAVKKRQAVLVDKLHRHWAVKPDQVNLLMVVDSLGRIDHIDDEDRQAILSILKTAQGIGIDLNQPVSGDDPSVQWKSNKEKPALVLHTLAKAAHGKPGQLELLQGMVALGIDPTVTDKRGWKARVFLAEEDRHGWDESVHRFAVRQRAADAMDEIMTGQPAPKRKRVRIPTA